MLFLVKTGNFSLALKTFLDQSNKILYFRRKSQDIAGRCMGAAKEALGVSALPQVYVCE